MIIALSGKRGTGKTTAAKFLAKNRGYTLVSFAEELRRLSRHIFPFTEADMSDPAKKESPWAEYEWSPRDFMVHFGEFVRFYDKDYWAKKVLNNLDPKKKYVIDDMRFPNEYELVKSLGAATVRINRYEHLNPFGKNLDIVSETSLDHHPFDYVIHDCRNTSLRSLHEEIDHVHSDLTEKRRGR